MVDEYLTAEKSPQSLREQMLLNGDPVSSLSLPPHGSLNSTDIYPDSVCSSSYEGGSGNVGSLAGTPASYVQSVSPGRDELTEKKKKNKKIKRAMKHMLPNTNPKSREHDFHKLFKSLPDGETLIQDFSCALLRDILIQGRLYVSQNWFCFYANILGWETLLTIEVSKITQIKKDKTALVINNAISISTAGEKYFFSSFMSRDSAYNHMNQIWRVACHKTVIDAGLANGEDIIIDDNSDSFIDDDDDDISSDMQPPGPSYQPGVSYQHTLGMVLNHPVPAANTLAVPSDHHGQRGTETISYNDEDMTCSCVSHFENEHLNQEFEFSIEKLYRLLFNENSAVQSKMWTLLKAEDCKVSQWRDSDEGASERTLTYKIPLNANLGPKWAEVIEKQVLTCESVATKCYVMNCEVTNPNVPYGDKFNITKRYCLTRSGDSAARLRLTSEVHYRKGVWGMVKSIIEKNSKEGINEYCEDLCMCLQEESAGPGIKIRKSTSSAGAHTSTGSTRQLRSRSSAAPQLSRTQATVSFVTDNYIAFILLMMAVLLSLNLVLVYRLSSITTGCSNQIDLLSSLPQSEEGKSEWIRILSQQQELHKKEIERWQDVLRWITKLVSEVHGSLEKLQKSSIYTKPWNTGQNTEL